MSKTKHKEYIDTFRAALRQAAQLGDETSIGSLLALAQSSKLLRPIIEDELAPLSGELEFHLLGENVIEHSANAAAFGELVRRIAASTQQFVKDQTNTPRQASELLVDVGPGSVRVTFKAPQRLVQNAVQLTIESTTEILPAEDVFSEALRRIAVVLANSDPDAPGSDALGAAIEQLPAASRFELSKALEPVKQQGWEIEGSFSQRGIGSRALKVGQKQADYLRNQLRAEVLETESWTTTGHLDGYRWSNGIAYFIPAGGTSAIPATFANATLQSAAAHLASVEENKVQATFTVYVRRSVSSSKPKRSYELRSIDPIGREK